MTDEDTAPGTAYVRRVVDHDLDDLLPGLAAISLEGAKGVGKTETALQRAGTVYRLDDAGQRVNVEADPHRLARGRHPILVDEWQRFPESWDIVRRGVDADPSPGQWLLTGSASPTEQPAHSGAGRIVTLRMRPMTLTERGIGTPTVSLAHLLSGKRPPIDGATDAALATYVEEITASGFPGIRALPTRARRVQLEGYIARITEREFEEFGHTIRNPAALRRWLTAYAAATSTTAAYEVIRDASTSGEGDKPAKTTTQPYRDILERLWVLDPVPGWLPTRNPISRLVEPPKHHLVDPALAAHLLDADAEVLLEATHVGPPIPRNGNLLGHLFESLVTLDVRVYAQTAEARVGHLRSKGGEHEIDLIVERGGRIVAIEVKLTRAVDDRDVRHLRWLEQQIGDDLVDAVVVTTGPEAYRRRDGIAVVPAALLGP